MALNLIKDLSKKGYSRLKNKSFLINKISNYNTEEIIKRNTILFEDPNTFLKLPKETNFHYIINKIPKGPQYDISNKLIPYTLVGTDKYIKRHKFQNLFGTKSFNRKSINFKARHSSLNRNNNLKDGYNLITDKEIKTIFDNYKNIIKENKSKSKDLIDEKECPKVMKQYIDKNLSLQEKCLKRKEDNLNIFKTLKGNIIQKMKFQSNKNAHKKEKSYKDSNSSSKDIHLSIGDLLMNLGDESRFKNKTKNFVDKENSEFILPEVNQKWENSLREPEQTIKNKKRIINYKLQKHPFWIYPSEKNGENIYKNKNKNYSIFNDSSLRTSSTQNMFIPESKKNQTNEDIFKIAFRKNFTSDMLEIQGKKLIDVEEKMNKNLKGKKKIMNFKNFNEELKDLVIYSNYTYNNHHTSK